MQHKNRHRRQTRGDGYFLAIFILGNIVFILTAGVASAELDTTYMYNLSSFTGAIPYSWAHLAVDKERNEIYVIYKNDIDVFNHKSMKVYNFGADSGIDGVIRDVAVDKKGHIYVLTHLEDAYYVIRCNYRGEPVSGVEFKNFPAGLKEFMPIRMIYREHRLYLADLLVTHMVVVTDTDGTFIDLYDIDSILGLKEYDKKPGQVKEIAGFSIDREGNMLLTVPTIFKAFRVTPDRKAQPFGDAGSIPGKFGVIAGIASDDDGNIYVVDTLKCVVIVFDKEFNFIKEFGLRGLQPGNLIAPRGIVSNNGEIFVSQSRKRGISVYRIRNL